jgi:hypothetical protein
VRPQLVRRSSPVAAPITFLLLACGDRIVTALAVGFLARYSAILIACADCDRNATRARRSHRHTCDGSNSGYPWHRHNWLR